MAVVIFSPEDFRQDFPQFADEEKYPDRRLRTAFSAAATLLDNTDASPVPYDPETGIPLRETLLYFLACHILTLSGWAEGGQAGPMSSASEGSVSVSFAVPQVTDKSYYLLSPCGQTYWRMTAPYRSGGRYYPVKHFHPWG
ncbi:MAG: DUF4054 domain-containing protein [Desulfovibrio sp.]|jgi:hypothetical protein|nr:DUF4054 domain-containing protein [Desulfovibrio sp.]